MKPNIVLQQLRDPYDHYVVRVCVDRLVDERLRSVIAKIPGIDTASKQNLRYGFDVTIDRAFKWKAVHAEIIRTVEEYYAQA